MKERLWTPDLEEMRERAEQELARTRGLLAEETRKLLVTVAEHKEARVRADELDAKLLVELEIQRKLKRDLHIAQELLEREAERATIVETDLATKQVRRRSLLLTTARREGALRSVKVCRGPHPICHD